MSADAGKPLSLQEIQRRMGAIVTNPLDGDFESKATLDDGRTFDEVARSICKPNERLTSSDRMAIYNRQYWYRLIDCLYDDFQGLHAILGREAFNALITAYLKHNPSRTWSLRDLGDKLPTFLRENPEFAGAKEIAAIQMAEFEWAQIHAFDTRSLPPVDPSVLTEVPADQLRFALQPYIKLLELSYPLDEFIVALHRRESTRSEAASTELAAANEDDPMVELPAEEKVYLAVHRFDNSLYYKRLDRGAFVLLQELAAGKSLAEAVASAADAVPAEEQSQLPDNVRRWFANFSELRWLCLPEKLP